MIVSQKAVEAEFPGATIVPIIISSDKTQLTLFRNKSAYPVYLTIGNLPKDIRRKPSRRGQVLLGYLPTTTLEHITNKTGRRRALANLFHACMKRILEPLVAAGIHGIEIASGDGAVRRCHPIFATFVGDYPEQLLVACCKYTHCPKCTVAPEHLEDNSLSPLRDLHAILDALETLGQGPTAYAQNCNEAGIKGVVEPFWQNLPYVDIFRSITPDILHQLYQGVVKHLVSWLTHGLDAAEIDARCRRMPPNHNLRHFSKGISTLSRVSGKEHGDMCRILLGLVIDLPCPPGVSRTRLLRSVRSLLDFLYIAQFPSHTTETLDYLTDALNTFHENKSVFINLGVRKNFNFPKLHSLQHYADSIKLFGTTDNYNTESTERLHIDLAKDAYRATNHKDEYSQMTIWLERREKIFRHQLFIDWRISGEHSAATVPSEPNHHTHIKMTHFPSVSGVTFDKLVSDYGAIDFRQALTVFIAGHNEPNLNRRQLQQAAYRIFLPFQRVSVFHTIKFWNPDPHGRSDALDTLDVAHVKPRRKGKNGWIPARMDTVLVDLDPDQGLGGIAGVYFAPFLFILGLTFL